VRRQEAVFEARLQDAQNRADKQGIVIAQALKKNESMEAFLKKVCICNASLFTHTYSTLIHFFAQQELRGAAVTVEEWKQAVEHAQSMIKREERKAAAERARYKRRLATLEEESERLRVSVMEAEAQAKAMEWSNKKVRVRVRVRVGSGLGLGLGLGCRCLVFVSPPFSSGLDVFVKESVVDVCLNE
jgi:hypothetical protein